VHFRRDARMMGRAAVKERPARTEAAAALDAAGQVLWETLRAWRLDEARRQEVPPYVIFHDTTLLEIARRRPASPEALALIPGIGRSKLDRYGAALLAVVAQTAQNDAAPRPAYIDPP
jgi:ATP-dependent DNA helicase RecQ